MPDDIAKTSLPSRYENGRFGPGNPGRPRGARGRIGHRVTMAILEDFMANKDKALANARYVAGPAYLNTIIKLLPADGGADLPDVRAWSDAEVADGMGRARTALRAAGDDRSALIALEAVLFGEEPAEPPPARLEAPK